MLKKYICFLIFFISISFSQSLETQLKIIFGDLLSASSNKNVRTLGKVLSTSGSMEYEFEKIKANNEMTINYNINSNGVATPNSGYEWVNHNNPNDFTVRKSIYSSNSGLNRPSLSPFDMTLLRKKFNKDKTGIDVAFTYNWADDINKDGALGLDEFFGIKRTFNKNEKIVIGYNWGIIFYLAKIRKLKKHYKNGGDVGIVITTTLYNKTDGQKLVESDYTKFFNEYTYSVNRWNWESLGSGNLPAGQYMYVITMKLPSFLEEQIHTKKLTEIEYFEVL